MAVNTHNNHTNTHTHTQTHTQPQHTIGIALVDVDLTGRVIQRPGLRVGQRGGRRRRQGGGAAARHKGAHDPQVIGVPLLGGAQALPLPIRMSGVEDLQPPMAQDAFP